MKRLPSRAFSLSLSIVCLGLLVSSAGCGVGPGSGAVTSSNLAVEGCSSGEFDLDPNFFAASSYADTVTLRIQRGDLLEEASDGLLVVVHDVAEIRGDDGGSGSLGASLEIGLPAGVAPPGVPVVADPDPPKVSIVLYLNDSCDDQNVSVYSTSGTITFESLWSGDVKEENSEDRLTVATFSGEFADSRALMEKNTGSFATSHLEGNFRFFFQRGQPAQPFP